MNGYKGFDRNLTCRGTKFEIGQTVEVATAELCKIGLHFCEHPLDCFGYYAPGAGSRYCEILADGDVTDRAPGAGGDTKRACRIRVPAVLSRP